MTEDKDEAVPFQDKMEALELYLQGLSTDKIVERTGISKEAVVSTIKGAREGKYPETNLRGMVMVYHDVCHTVYPVVYHL